MAVDVTDRRLAHHARGQVDSVAHHRVPPPVLRPHLAGEHRPTVDTDLHRQRRIGRRRSAAAPGAFAPRRPRPPAGRRRSGGSCRRRTRCRSRGSRPRSGRTRPGRSRRAGRAAAQRARAALAGDQVRSSPRELQEGNRRRPVLGIGVTAQQVLAHDRRQAARRSHPRPASRDRPPPPSRTPPAHAPAASPVRGSSPRQPTRQPLGGLRAQQDLPRRRDGSPSRPPATRPVRRSAAHDAIRRPGTSRTRRCGRRPTCGARRRSRRRGSARPRAGSAASRPPTRRRAGVLLAGEPQEHRVAAELQQRPAAAVGVGQQRREARVDRVDQVLRSLLALARQPLRQSREARDIGEHHRPLEHLSEFLSSRSRHPREQHSGT